MKASKKAKRTNPNQRANVNQRLPVSPLYENGNQSHNGAQRTKRLKGEQLALPDVKENSFDETDALQNNKGVIQSTRLSLRSSETCPSLPNNSQLSSAEGQGKSVPKNEGIHEERYSREVPPGTLLDLNLLPIGKDHENCESNSPHAVPPLALPAEGKSKSVPKNEGIHEESDSARVPPGTLLDLNLLLTGEAHENCERNSPQAVPPLALPDLNIALDLGCGTDTQNDANKNFPVIQTEAVSHEKEPNAEVVQSDSNALGKSPIIQSEEAPHPKEPDAVTTINDVAGEEKQRVMVHPRQSKRTRNVTKKVAESFQQYLCKKRRSQGN